MMCKSKDCCFCCTYLVRHKDEKPDTLVYCGINGEKIPPLEIIEKRCKHYKTAFFVVID